MTQDRRHFYKVLGGGWEAGAVDGDTTRKQ